MVSRISVGEKIINFVLDVHDSKKLAVIALIPLVGSIWVIAKHRRLNDAMKNTKIESERISLLQQKNQVQTFSAHYGMVQCIIYAVAGVFLGVATPIPVFLACTLGFHVLTFNMAAVHTAKTHYSFLKI